MKPTDPKFVIKLPPKEVEALETWLDQARELDAHLHRGSAELRGLETKLAKAQAEAEKLRPKALNLGLLFAYILRMTLIVAATWVVRYWTTDFRRASPSTG